MIKLLLGGVARPYILIVTFFLLMKIYLYNLFSYVNFGEKSNKTFL